MRVLGISGSLRRDSYNSRLVRAAASELPPDTRFHLLEGLAELPPFSEDAEYEPPLPAVARLRGALEAADAVVIATPEYNASIPGVLKNAVDWASRPYPDNALKERPVLVIGASTGLFGAVWAQADLRKSLRYAGAHVLDDELPVPLAAQAFDDDGRLRDPELAQRLRESIEALLREVAVPVEQLAT